MLTRTGYPPIHRGRSERSQSNLRHKGNHTLKSRHAKGDQATRPTRVTTVSRVGMRKATKQHAPHG